MRSMGTVLDDNRGLGQGFDFMRVALALGVIVWHAPFILSQTDWVDHGGVVWLASYSILIMFFGLSGFLITGSAIRLGLSNFLINRGLRIFPALAVEIILSALILGPIFTSLSFSAYFSNPATWQYFTNVIGLVNYKLPGVFDGQTVNASIWTVPFEMICYIIMSCWIYFGLLRRPWLILIFAVGVLVIEIVADHSVIFNASHNYFKSAIYYLFEARGSRLIPAFCFGVVAYLYRYKIPFSKVLLFSSLVFVILAEWIGDWHTEQTSTANFFIVVPVVYITLYLGLSKLPKLPFFHRGDYSYGIYLYAWPVTQAIKTVMPAYVQNPVSLIAWSLPPIVIFSAFSWHFIEKPILHMRRKFSFVARQRLAEAGPEAGLAGASQDVQPIAYRQASPR